MDSQSLQIRRTKRRRQTSKGILHIRSRCGKEDGEEQQDKEIDIWRDGRELSSQSEKEDITCQKDDGEGDPGRLPGPCLGKVCMEHEGEREESIGKRQPGGV